MHILTLKIASRHIPEAGAVCGSSARTDLSGGRQVTAVPTATLHYMDPPYWQTAGYGVDFPFENYERMADFMRRCKGRVMVSINEHPDIRRVFEGFHFETLGIRYSNTNQRQGKAELSGELVIMNWVPSSLGGLF